MFSHFLQSLLLRIYENGDQLSRRRLLSTFAGSAAIFGTALAIGSSRVAEAQSKTDKKTAMYQDHPNKGQECVDCSYFRPPHSCQLVAGQISPQGWCSFFSKKPS
jgi:High potential iron-sulfur protein